MTLQEIPFDTEMVVVSLPGSVVVEAVRASRARAFLDPPQDWGGYMQLDDGFRLPPTSPPHPALNRSSLNTDRNFRLNAELHLPRVSRSRMEDVSAPSHCLTIPVLKFPARSHRFRP